MSELYNLFFPSTERLARTDVGSSLISTIAASDSDSGFETAIMDPRFNNDDWIIVECYDSKEKALVGHQKWCKFMENPPAFIKENGDNFVLKLMAHCNDGVQQIYPRKDIQDSIEFDLVLNNSKEN